MRLFWKSSSLVALAAGACAPMEQAPLVYASKQQFGVHVSAGAPETPGLEVSIGYKGLDAAFVPVVVAKYCGNSPSIDCENAIYGLTTISGTNVAGGSVTIDQQALAALQARIDQNAQLLAKAQADIRADEALKDANALQRNRKASLDAELANIEANPADPANAEAAAQQTARKAAIDAEMKTINALETDESINARLKSNRDSAAALSATLEQDRLARGRMVAGRNASSSDDKRDAYSVYGSFNGTSAGDSKGANLSLGKVFSTGIAAQNLTQGIGQAARVSGQAGCLQELKRLSEKVSDDRRDDFLTDTSGLCSNANPAEYSN